ncbi:MAG: carbamoyltransferase N-terminal domain-containing protein [Puia sp.]|nr:carbamoyltransferase N-terminal domain-containing protein [Puia sp.]
MVILGISAFFHDSAAAIIRNGQVVAAAQEERFTRIKNDPSFPIHSIRFCLEFARVAIDELDAVVFYDKPLLKLERILESYHATAPRGLRSFLRSMPVWMKQKMLLKKVIRDELYQLQSFDKKKLRLLFCEHHLSHAASAFYVSPYQEAAILTIDGVGEWATTSIGKGRGKDLSLLKEIRFPHSPGLLYSAFTYYCGFKVNSGEYKLMGLAPYGDETSPQFKEFVEKIRSHLVTVYDDGSLFLHQEYFNYISGLRMVKEGKWRSLFGMSPRPPESALDPGYCNLALAIQRVTEDIVLRLAATARRLTGMENICMAGGVALNCVANGKLLDAAIFKNIYIQPAAGDAGGALGAALAAYHIYFGKERREDFSGGNGDRGFPGRAGVPAGGESFGDKEIPGRAELFGDGDPMRNCYLGPAFTIKEVRKMCRDQKAVFHEYDDRDELAAIIAAQLRDGKIVGWFQGQMEFGPRALGNRSILADPGSADMQRKLNLHIKYREGFRPFAPVCLEEKARDYFGLAVPSPYMLLTRPLNKNFRKALPDGYPQLTVMEKLNVVRSLFPAITHVDFSSRVQTVSRKSNSRLWGLLKAFESLTGNGMLINTSFNVRGEPVVCTPEEAYRCFKSTEMDILVLDNIIIFKHEQ